MSWKFVPHMLPELLCSTDAALARRVTQAICSQAFVHIENDL